MHTRIRTTLTALGLLGAVAAGGAAVAGAASKQSAQQRPGETELTRRHG